MRIDKKELAKKLLLIVAAVAILSYAVFHIASLFGDEISTVVVGSSTEYSSVSLDGYIFRDATLINSNYSGAISYSATSGGRVAKGDTIATVYESGDLSASRDFLLALDKEIALLERSTEDTLSMPDLPALKKKAASAYYSIMKALSGGNASEVGESKDKLVVALNSIEMLTDSEFSIKDTLNTLRAARQSFVSAGGAAEIVLTDKSGYFYASADGYEKVLTESAALTLEGTELRELLYSAKPERVPDNCVGKLSDDADWYFVTEVEGEKLGSFAEGSEYAVEFLGGGGYTIKMKLVRLLPLDESGLLVLSTDVLPDGFSFARRQSVRIILGSVSGIYIPTSALHRVDHKDTVYILKGSVVCQRRVEIIYRGDDYCVVRDGGEDADGEAYLKTNDLLIIGGSNLFDGRILD